MSTVSPPDGAPLPVLVVASSWPTASTVASSITAIIATDTPATPAVAPSVPYAVLTATDCIGLLQLLPLADGSTVALWLLHTCTAVAATSVPVDVTSALGLYCTYYGILDAPV